MIETPDWYRPQDPLRSPTFVARALGVTVQTVHRWLRKGALTYIEVGPHRRKRIYESEIAKQRIERVA